MPEYNNILTRMLGADSFPYRNVTITDKVTSTMLHCVGTIHSCTNGLTHNLFVCVSV